LRDALAPTHRVLTPDLLGYATAGPWPAGKPFHYQADVDVIAALVASQVAAGDEPVHLVGHSYGGFLACHVARAMPASIRSLAVYEPVTFSVLDPVEDADVLAALAPMKTTWDADERGVDDGWLEGFVDWWNGAGAWAALPADTKDSFRAVGWKLFQEVVSLVADRTGAAGFAAITAPALLMVGSRSPMTEQRTVERLAATLPASTLRRFDGVGHMAPITHQAMIDAAIIEHIRAH
jgi:pimeloyl-ACP methyl ester carboxylesterase